MIAQVNKIVRHEGKEYRLHKGREAPEIPDSLKRSLKKLGYVKESQPAPNVNVKEGGK